MTEQEKLEKLQELIQNFVDTENLSSVWFSVMFTPDLKTEENKQGAVLVINQSLLENEKLGTTTVLGACACLSESLYSGLSQIYYTQKSALEAPKSDEPLTDV